MPNTVLRSSSAQASRSASLALRARVSPNRPKDSRSSSTWPIPADRLPHLRVDSVMALECRASPVATSTPDCGGNGVPAGSASARTAAEAIGTRAAAAADRGAIPPSRAAACGAATATTTASVCQCSPAPSARVQPPESGAIPVTGAWIQSNPARVMSSSSSTR